MKPLKIFAVVAFALLQASFCFPTYVLGQEKRATSEAVRELEDQQKQLAIRFSKLEELFIRMSELEAAENPTRAGLLLQAAQMSKQLSTLQRLSVAGDLLSEGKFTRAIQEQEASRDNLKKLLELLQSENRSSRLRDERARIEDIQKEIRRLEQIQRGQTARTEAGQDLKQAEQDQKDIKNQLEKVDSQLGSQDKPSDDKPSDNKPSDDKPSDDKPSDSKPSDSSSESSDSKEPPKPESREERAKKRVEAAKQRMQNAEDKLKQENRDEAVQEQREAENELREAIEELEKILRQLREEEIERSLVDVETRLRKMLELQKAVREETERLGNLTGDLKDRTLEIQANKLSIEQSKVVIEGQRALLLLQDEGSSTAFPEALEQVNSDAQLVVKRLTQANVSMNTKAIEDEVIGAVEEMLESLQQVQKKRDDKKKRQNQQQQQQSGSEEDEPLVDSISELRLLKTLQLRVNRRTQSLSKETNNPDDSVGQVGDPSLLGELQDLAERQEKIHEVTRDILLKAAKE
jgi:hypothetical protein